MERFYKKLNRIGKKQNGFTLIETLVAISIFTVSLLAVISVLTNGISNTNYAKTRITASYLAQEGIEYMRNMRDTFVLYDDGTSAQNGWNLFNAKIAPSGNTLCASANGCYFGDLADSDFSNNSKPITSIPITACASSCIPLKYDPATGKYGYTLGTNSAFTRKINVTQPSLNETKITSTVTWRQGSGNYSIVFSESLFNWVE